jgi:hypothetical protein
MAQPTGFAPDKETPEQALTRIGRAIYQNEQIIKSAKPGSAQFKKAEAALKELKKQFAIADAEVNKKRAVGKKAAADKATAKAYEDLDRANALGDEEAAKKARERITKAEADAKNTGIKTYNQQRQEQIEKSGVAGYTGSGTKDKPLTLGNEPFTGTYKGKKYTNGILVVETGDGTGKGKGKGTVVDTGKDTGLDVKTLWVSYLRSTFATLEDKTQKAQIDNLLNLAKQQEWDEDTFIEALKGTIWWQTTLPSMRQFFLDSHDPRQASTFTEKVRNQIASVTDKLEALGVSVQVKDPVTGKLVDNSEYIRGIAMDAIKNGWDDNQLENWLAEKGSIIFTGGGTLGTYFDKVKQTAFMYGAQLDDNMQKEINLSLLDPNDGRDVNFWVNSIKQDAINNPQYKPFQESLRQGRTLYEVTNSYRQQMANLLEVDSTAITWNDLLGKVVDGTTGNARTFADFTKALKQDPLWQYTRNAKETYSNMALDLAKMFGFAG